MTKLVVIILDLKRLLWKSSNIDSIGPICLRMHEYYINYTKCQVDQITKRDMMPLNLILIVEIFDV